MKNASAKVFSRKFKGICTSWLERMCSPLIAGPGHFPEKALTVPIFLRDAKEFVLPTDISAPLTFIGPGTGVAPFRGFLQHLQSIAEEKEETKDDLCCGNWRMGFEIDGLQDDAADEAEEPGRIDLFFGCQRRDVDFLYEEELRRFQHLGVLSALHVAFSREQEEKIYVQDRIREDSSNIYATLTSEKGRVYVCGDGAKMAIDVDVALQNVLVTEGGMSEADAKAKLKALTAQGRYIRDVWS